MDEEFNANKWRRETLFEENVSEGGFIEPEEMISHLNKMYHTIAGNQRDYLAIPHLEELIKTLSLYK